MLAAFGREGGKQAKLRHHEERKSCPANIWTTFFLFLLFCAINKVEPLLRAHLKEAATNLGGGEGEGGPLISLGEAAEKKRSQQVLLQSLWQVADWTFGRGLGARARARESNETVAVAEVQCTPLANFILAV